MSVCWSPHVLVIPAHNQRAATWHGGGKLAVVAAAFADSKTPSASSCDVHFLSKKRKSVATVRAFPVDGAANDPSRRFEHCWCAVCPCASDCAIPELECGCRIGIGVELELEPEFEEWIGVEWTGLGETACNSMLLCGSKKQLKIKRGDVRTYITMAGSVPSRRTRVAVSWACIR